MQVRLIRRHEHRKGHQAYESNARLIRDNYVSSYGGSGSTPFAATLFCAVFAY
jgi:hypothetical protein